MKINTDKTAAKCGNYLDEDNKLLSWISQADRKTPISGSPIPAGRPTSSVQTLRKGVEDGVRSLTMLGSASGCLDVRANVEVNE